MSSERLPLPRPAVLPQMPEQKNTERLIREYTRTLRTMWHCSIVVPETETGAHIVKHRTHYLEWLQKIVHAFEDVTAETSSANVLLARKGGITIRPHKDPLPNSNELVGPLVAQWQRKGFFRQRVQLDMHLDITDEKMIEHLSNIMHYDTGLNNERPAAFYALTPEERMEEQTKLLESFWGMRFGPHVEEVEKLAEMHAETLQPHVHTTPREAFNPLLQTIDDGFKMVLQHDGSAHWIHTYQGALDVFVMPQHVISNVRIGNVKKTAHALLVPVRDGGRSRWILQVSDQVTPEEIDELMRDTSAGAAHSNTRDAA